MQYLPEPSLHHKASNLCKSRLPWGCRWLLFLLTFTLLQAAQATESNLAKPLLFGVYTHTRSTEMHNRMGPMQVYLQNALADHGIRTEIQLKIFPSYNEGIEALAQGEVDFVRYGPASYVLAKERNPNIRLLAIESNQGKKTLNGVISVPIDSPIQSIQDLHGKRVAFGNRRSSTGRYMSQSALLHGGISAKDLADYEYLGRHDKVAFAVAAGNYDAGATNENTFNKYAASKGLRKILEFTRINRPWVARAGLDQQVFRALQDALLELKDPEVLKTIKRSGLIPTEEKDYEQIRNAIAETGGFDPTSLTFGIYAWVKPSDAYNMIQPVVRLLERELISAGQMLNLRIKVFRDYKQAIDALYWGDVDFMRLGPASCALVLERNPDIRLLAQEHTAGAPPTGVFVVPADSEVSRIAQLAGRRVAFGNSFSTEGHYLAQARLLDAGLHATDLAAHSYLGRHDQVAYAVGKGIYDAGVLLESVLRDYTGDRPLRVIGRFESTNHLLVARANLDQDRYNALRQGLLNIPASQELAPLGIDGFVPTESNEACSMLRQQILKASSFDPAQ